MKNKLMDYTQILFIHYHLIRNNKLNCITHLRKKNPNSSNKTTNFSPA